MEFRVEAGSDGDERVDGDVGERIRQPRHAQKCFCPRGRRTVRIGRRRGGIRARGGWHIFVRELFHPERQGELRKHDDDGRDDNAR